MPDRTRGESIDSSGPLVKPSLLLPPAQAAISFTLGVTNPIFEAPAGSPAGPPHLETSMRLGSLALALAALAASCGAPSASFTPRIMNYEVSGDLLVSEGAATTSSDVERLGMSEDDGSFAPKAELNWGGFQLALAHADTEHSGTGVADADLELDGITISGSDTVFTDFKMAKTDVLLTWDVLPSETVDVGLGFGAALLDLDASIESLTVPGAEIATDEQVPVPMLAGRVGVEIGDLELQGLISGLSVDVDGNTATVIDLDVGLDYALVDLGGSVVGAITVGYKSFDIDVEYDDGSSGSVDLDLGFSGPYFGITLTL